MIRRALLLVVVGLASADITSRCDANKFVLCQKRFSDTLGIDDSFNWLDPVGLTSQIQNIYARGTAANPQQKGIVSVCNAYNQLLQCLHESAFTAFECFDPLFLISADASPRNAYTYAFLMNMVQFQCSAGFYPALDNWSCLQSMYVGQNNTLTGCLRTFQTDIDNDPSNSCMYVGHGMKCWSNAALGCPDAAVFYACESFRQYTTPRFGRCYHQCVVGPRTIG